MSRVISEDNVQERMPVREFALLYLHFRSVQLVQLLELVFLSNRGLQNVAIRNVAQSFVPCRLLEFRLNACNVAVSAVAICVASLAVPETRLFRLT